MLAIATFVVYWHGLSAPFVFDDRGTIVDNRTIENLWSRDVFSAPHETPVAGRPVVNVSFALNYAIDGRHVEGYRLTNIGIHVLCALALFGLAWRTSLPVNVALAVALLWALHPLTSEAVNYATQRTESMMALFYLLTLYCARRAYDDGCALRMVGSRRRTGVHARHGEQGIDGHRPPRRRPLRSRVPV